MFNLSSGLVIENEVVSLSMGNRTGMAAQVDNNELPAVFRDSICFTIGTGTVDALESPQCHPVLPGQCSPNSRTYIPGDSDPIILSKDTGERQLMPRTNPPTFLHTLTWCMIASTVVKALSCSFGGASVVESRSYRIATPPSEVRHFNHSDVYICWMLDRYGDIVVLMSIGGTTLINGDV